MKKVNFISAVIMCIIFIGVINAQENKSTWGISAALQDTQLDIMFPIWAGTSYVIAPTIGVIHIGEIGTDLRIGLVNRIFLNTTEKIKPFLGLRVGALFSMPDEGDSVIDYIVGFLGGGEYFFSDSFSVGVEAQLNMSISDEASGRFGNPGGINLNSATALFATVYF